MNKKIGVFIGEIAQEYQEIVAKGIAKKAEELGYDVIYICTYGNYTDDILYIEGEKCRVFKGFQALSFERLGQSATLPNHPRYQLRHTRV